MAVACQRHDRHTRRPLSARKDACLIKSSRARGKNLASAVIRRFPASVPAWSGPLSGFLASRRASEGRGDHSRALRAGGHRPAHAPCSSGRAESDPERTRCGCGNCRRAPVRSASAVDQSRLILARSAVEAAGGGAAGSGWRSFAPGATWPTITAARRTVHPRPCRQAGAQGSGPQGQGWRQEKQCSNP